MGHGRVSLPHIIALLVVFSGIFVQQAWTARNHGGFQGQDQGACLASPLPATADGSKGASYHPPADWNRGFSGRGQGQGRAQATPLAPLACGTGGRLSEDKSVQHDDYVCLSVLCMVQAMRQEERRVLCPVQLGNLSRPNHGTELCRKRCTTAVAEFTELDSKGRVPSPRQRNQSPRRTGKGRDKGKGKGKGKDVGKDGKQGKGNPSQPPGIVPPSLPALPPPPKVPPLPKASPSPPPSDAAASDAQVKLDALLTTLRSSKDAAHLVGESELAASQQQSKALHKAISAQDAARKELHKVQNACRAYLASWSSYVGQLQTLLTTQMEEQDQALQDFQKHEQRWQKQLKEASKTLAALSGGKGDAADKDGPTTVTLTSGSDMDEDSEDGKQDPWAALDQAQKLRDGQQELAAALSKAREKAEIAAKQAKRDSSRSPRRQRDRETEEAKDSKDSKEMDAKLELPLNALT